MPSLDFDFMQSVQKALQEKYRERWGAVCPAVGRDKILWMIGEVSEMSDIIKKDGDEAIMNDPAVREHFIEEMCDVLMYFNDVMLCYDISPDDLQKKYIEKHEKNMKRW